MESNLVDDEGQESPFQPQWTFNLKASGQRDPNSGKIGRILKNGNAEVDSDGIAPSEETLSNINRVNPS